MAKSGIRILESNAQIQKMIEQGLRKDAHKMISQSISRIKSRITPIIRTALSTCPEIQSLSGGKLAADFGLTDDPSGQIVSAIVASLNVRPRKGNAREIGGVIVELQPTSFSNLLGLSSAEQEIDGGSIPWLSWLLTQGDTIILAGYGVEYGDYGRSGQARMNRSFAPFKVDSSYSGTAENNFITRAIDKVSSQIRSAIQGSIV